MLLQQTKQTKLLVVNSKTTSRFATLPNLLPQTKPLGTTEHATLPNLLPQTKPLRTIEPSTINFNHSSFLQLSRNN